MCGGGFFRDSVILLSGATGTGKTLITTSSSPAASRPASAVCCFAFEESRDQLFRNAPAGASTSSRWRQEGKLAVVCAYPEVGSLEDHLISLKKVIEEFRPDRVAVDSLSALERVATVKSFREFVIGLTSFIKHREIAGLFTATTANLLGGSSVTETHISTITDSIILLRYVEMYRRNAARPDGAEDARLDARQGHPRVHHRRHAACTSASRSAASRASCRATSCTWVPVDGYLSRCWTGNPAQRQTLRREQGRILARGRRSP